VAEVREPLEQMAEMLSGAVVLEDRVTLVELVLLVVEVQYMVALEVAQVVD
jgi:hypothetical protein